MKSNLQSSPPLHRSDRGAALIIVLWLTLGLVAVVLLYGQSSMLEYRASEYSVAGAQARQATSGAHRYLTLVLRDLVQPGQIPSEEDFQASEVRIGDGCFWLIGRNPDTAAGNEPVFGFVDEAGKLNINTASQEMLQALPRMTSDLAAAIIDWRDSDSDLTQGGAETQDYLLMNPAYQCKNGMFETVEELRLVKGMDLEILFGEDRNRNGILDPHEDSGSGVPHPGLLEYVTVWSREPNYASNGDKRVNLAGSNSRQAVREALATVLDPSRAQSAVGQAGSLTSIRSVLEFYLRAGLSLEECRELDGLLSVSDEDYLVGLVNINTAPREVLMAIPGIGSENADAVIAWRAQRNSEERASVRWLGEVLDRAAAMQAGPYVTARSFQISADVAAVGESGRGLQRIWMVFDTSSMLLGGEDDASPIVVYRRDLGDLGFPLGTEIRRMLMSVEWRKEQGNG